MDEETDEDLYLDTEAMGMFVVVRNVMVVVVFVLVW